MGFNSAFKGLDAELNPICLLLALLGAHHILHVSGVRVNVLRLRSDQSKLMARFYGLNSRSVSGSISLWLVVVLTFFYSSVPVITRGLGLFSGTYFHKLGFFLWFPGTDNGWILGVHQVRCFFVWRRKQSWLPKRHDFKQNRWWTK